MGALVGGLKSVGRSSGTLVYFLKIAPEFFELSALHVALPLPS